METGVITRSNLFLVTPFLIQLIVLFLVLMKQWYQRRVRERRSVFRSGCMYLRQLNDIFTFYPNLSNTLASGFIGAVGDLMAQTLERSNTDHPYNFTRSGYVLGFGLLTGSPAIQWFRFLDRFYGNSGSRLTTVAKKVVTNQLVFSPTLTAFFYIYINACQHFSSGIEKIKEESYKTITREFIPSMITSSVYWPCVQSVNFLVVPLHYRVVCNSFFAAGWNCFLSFCGHRK
eukprot:TRINITY_DN9694_c0_g2_i1.p1 TRINITY_DN9694_c0_g2~~TRINITY_DN9694_c0_g2_i1.p1  ORF type:complete len:231 (-),score=28.98 TRINITY_DN9694_c0_g2_i1:181-873(-)